MNSNATHCSELSQAASFTVRALEAEGCPPGGWAGVDTAKGADLEEIDPGRGGGWGVRRKFLEAAEHKREVFRRNSTL